MAPNPSDCLSGCSGRCRRLSFPHIIQSHFFVSRVGKKSTRQFRSRPPRLGKKVRGTVVILCVLAGDYMLTMGCLNKFLYYKQNHSDGDRSKICALPGICNRNPCHHKSHFALHSICDFYPAALPMWSDSLAWLSLFSQVPEKS